MHVYFKTKNNFAEEPKNKTQTGKYVVSADDLRAQIFCHVRNGQSNLKTTLVKRAGTYKKVLLHMRRPCEGGFPKRANMTGRNIFCAQKTNFPVWNKTKDCDTETISSTLHRGLQINKIQSKIPGFIVVVEARVLGGSLSIS